MTFRRSYAGGATGQTLVGPITSVATTATISDNAGWPSGASGPFAVVIDRGTNTEEKALCSAQSANTLTFTTRGYDGTGAQAHAAAATIEICVTAIDLDEANAHTSAAAGVHNVVGSVVGTTDVQTLTNKNLVQPVIADHTLAQHDHSSTVQGGLIAGYVTTPDTGLAIHKTASLPFTYNPGGVALTHGAGYTPTWANVMMVDWLTTWTNVKIISVNSTTVNFQLFNGTTEATTGNCHAVIAVM